MKTLLLTGVTSALVLSASLKTASATTIGFTSQIVDYTVPEDGTYHIVATGAQGGTEPHRVGGDSVGGTGERVGADFKLTMNEVLQIAVGGKGGDGPTSALVDGAGGGGGGTFVVGPVNGTDSILLAAGGGGGGGAGRGQDGLTPEGLQAQNGVSDNGGAAGANGLGGSGGNGSLTAGGGGGGFVGNGGTGSSDYRAGAGGKSFANGLGGGGSGTQGGGGFGGGGGGGQGDEYGGGGGGGGYDGGGGGGSGSGGGSGGSFFGSGATNTLFAPVAMPDGNGSVIITELPSDLGSSAPVPEPASLALFGTGALSLLALRRARRR